MFNPQYGTTSANVNFYEDQRPIYLLDSQGCENDLKRLTLIQSGYVQL